MVRRFGYSAITQAVGHQISKKNSGYEEDSTFDWAFKQAFQGNTLRTYREVKKILTKLPAIKEDNDGLLPWERQNIEGIVDIILRLIKSFK